MNHKTYKLNLEKSNKDRKAYWELEYSAKVCIFQSPVLVNLITFCILKFILNFSFLSQETYDMKGLQPADWDNLVARMKKSDDIFEKFYK